MSGIAGCLNLDGAPVDRALLERMMRRLVHRAPDGSGLWTGGAAGLAHLAFHTTPEAVREHQPLADASGQKILTLDGRVDNRAELISALRAQDFAPRDDTDAELVLQAYRCWGENCPARILGDFAFAVWDRSAEKLFCARDVAGVRSFYYFRDAQSLVWASDLCALFEHSRVSRTPNERVVAEYLGDTIVSREDTLFRDVRRLPPGYSLTATRDGVRLARYWDIAPERILRYRTDDEYAEHFRELFREAVRCRLRSHGPVGTDLSGGLDSSAIVGMAQSLRAEGAAAPSGFEVFSLTFPGLACDERPYIDAVLERWRPQANLIEATLPDGAYYERQVREDCYLPYMPVGTMLLPLRRLQASKGIRVVLDGRGGDEWFTGSVHVLADLFSGAHLLRILRDWRALSTTLDFPLTPRRLVRYGAWPVLPLWLRLGIRRVLAREGSRPYLSESIARHLPSARYLCQELDRGTCRSYDQADTYAMLHFPELQRVHEEIERRNARLGVESRWPFMDRRLIEFAFALPSEQRLRAPWTRYVVRHGLRGILPESVAMRTTKADFSHTVAETLQRQDLDFSSACSALERAGWVRGDAVRRIYEEILTRYNGGDERYSASIWPVWWIFGLGLWLNSVVLAR